MEKPSSLEGSPKPARRTQRQFAKGDSAGERGETIPCQKRVNEAEGGQRGHDGGSYCSQGMQG